MSLPDLHADAMLLAGFVMAARENIPAEVSACLDRIIGKKYNFAEQIKQSAGINPPDEFYMRNLVTSMMLDERPEPLVSQKERDVLFRKDPRKIIVKGDPINEYFEIPSHMVEESIQKTPENDHVEETSSKSEHIGKKLRKPWSDEARAAAGERMRLRQAQGIMGKKPKAAPPLDIPPGKKSLTADNWPGIRERIDVLSWSITSTAKYFGVTQAEMEFFINKMRHSERLEQEELEAQEEEIEEKPFVPVTIEKLQKDHDEFIGKREPDQELQDSDWPDIQAMLQKGIKVRAIASDYEVPVTVMDKFCDKWLLETARQKDANARGPRTTASGFYESGKKAGRKANVGDFRDENF